MPVPPNNKFAQKPGAGGAAAAKKPMPVAKPKPKPRKFGAPSEHQPRDPMLDAGFSGKVRHIGAEELLHPVYKSLSWRVQFLVFGEEENGTRIALYMNTTAGVAEYQRYCVAMAGYQTAAEFTEFALSVMPDADAEEAGDAFFSSVIGDANPFSEAGYTIERRLAHVVVTRGKPVIDKETGQPKLGPDGEPDYYRNYKWTVVPDEEQDEAGRLEVAAE
jgi:hypothetical protein